MIVWKRAFLQMGRPIYLQHTRLEMPIDQSGLRDYSRNNPGPGRPLIWENALGWLRSVGRCGWRLQALPAPQAHPASFRRIPVERLRPVPYYAGQHTPCNVLFGRAGSEEFLMFLTCKRTVIPGQRSRGTSGTAGSSGIRACALLSSCLDSPYLNTTPLARRIMDSQSRR